MAGKYRTKKQRSELVGKILVISAISTFAGFILLCIGGTIIQNAGWATGGIIIGSILGGVGLIAVIAWGIDTWINFGEPDEKIAAAKRNYQEQVDNILGK